MFWYRCVAMSGLVMLLVPACTSANETPASTVSSSMAATTTIAVTTTTVSAPTTVLSTTTTSPHGFTVGVPMHGQYITEQPLDWVSGRVKPEADVALDGEPLLIDAPSEYPEFRGWWDWFITYGEWSHGLVKGDNTLDFVASFDDGITLSEAVTITFDPTMVRYPGFVSGFDLYDSGDRYEMTFEAGTINDQPDGWFIENTSTVVFPVRWDAVFIVKDADLSHRTMYSVEEFAAIIDFINDGLCLDCLGGDCPDRCIWASWNPNGFGGIEFEIYVNTVGEVQQGIHLIGG